MSIISSIFPPYFVLRRKCFADFYVSTYVLRGPGSSAGIAGRSGDWIPVGVKFSTPVQTGPGAHPASCTKGTWFFPGGKERPGRDADPSPLLVPWSRKGRATHVLPLWTVRPVQSLSACTRVTFTFYFCFILCACLKNFTVKLLWVRLEWTPLKCYVLIYKCCCF